ncbi:VPLPA-CTERM sorting domain-containing protein [Albidovulum aquaemixtae]|nr:VPLPA-CTERM sorting domain-containing protein [Defluviimonas aquaemixtae]
MSLAIPAWSTTITFSSLPDEGAALTSYTENGITATAGSGTLGWFTSPGSAHVDDSGTGFTADITFTTGGIFDAVGFTLTSLGYSMLSAPGPVTDNILVTGYVGGSLVAGANYTLSSVAGAVQNILLGTAFTGIDALTISLLYPRNVTFCDAPCGHFDLNDVTLAAVPLPASALMLGVAALGLGLVARRRKI